MKKLALLFTLLLGVTLVSAEAQTSARYGQKYFTSKANGKTPTITNPATPATSAPIYSDTATATGSNISKYMQINAYPFQSVTVTVYATKSTGTRAGKFTLEGSDDGNTWARIRSLYGTASPCDSVVIADASGTIVGQMAVKNLGNRFLRVNYTTTNSTQVTFLKALATYKLD